MGTDATEANKAAPAAAPAPDVALETPCVDLVSYSLKIDHFEHIHSLQLEGGKVIKGAPNFRQVRW